MMHTMVYSKSSKSLKKIEKAQMQSNDSAMEEESIGTGTGSEMEEASMTDDDDDGRRRSLTPLSIKGMEQVDTSYTDDEGGDEMDSDDDDEFPLHRKGATKKSVPLFDEKKNQTNEDEEFKKNGKKITAKQSPKKQKKSKQNENEEKEKKKTDDAPQTDEQSAADDDASKKKSKKLKKDEKAAPSRSSKKPSKENLQEENKTDQVKMRPTRITAAKANQKIRDGAKNEQKPSDDEEDDDQQHKQQKDEKEFEDDDESLSPHHKSTAGSRKRKADRSEKQQTTMKGKKTSIDQTQQQTRKNVEDTHEEKIPPESRSDEQTPNIDGSYATNEPFEYTPISTSMHKSSNNKRMQTAENRPFIFEQANTLDDRMKISQQETVHDLSRSIANITQAFDDLRKQNKQNGDISAILMKNVTAIERMISNNDHEWRNSCEEMTKSCMRVMQITKTLYHENDGDTKKRKSFNIDNEMQEKSDNAIIDERPQTKYARLDDSNRYRHHPSSVSQSTIDNQIPSANRTAATNKGSMVQRLMNQLMHSVHTPPLPTRSQWPMTY